MSHDKRKRSGGRDAGRAGGLQARRPAPGKRTLTAGIPARAQARAAEHERGSEPTGDGTRAPRDLVGPGYGSPLPPMEQQAPPAQEGGASDLLPHRQRMEKAFGEDFTGLSVSLGAAAELDAIDASAATDGDSVSFASASPAAEEVAHELAHVVQHRQHGGGAAEEVGAEGHEAEQEADLVAARVARGGEAGTMKQRPGARIQRRTRGAAQHPDAAADVVRRYDAFVDGVYAAARRIVVANIQAVEAWRNYVLNQLTPQEMGAQVFGTGFGQLEEQAAANNARHLLAPYSAEANPVRQSLYEHQMAGEWRACTGCHVSNQAWALDARTSDARRPGLTPAQLLTRHAGLPVSGDGAASVDVRLFTDPAAWSTAFGPRLGPPVATQASPAAPVPAQAAARPSHPLETPVDPGRRQEESLTAARLAMRAIQPHLQALGDRGYKIIPSNVISRFGHAPIEELRGELAAAFARRLSGYQQLMGKIGAQSIEYLEFDSLVSMLKPMATPEVRALVDDDLQRRQVREAILFVGMLLVDLLSIVLPPVAVVAGAMHVVHGIDQVAAGTDRANATGMHALMSPERQASGSMMQVAGSLEVIGGALQVALATSGLGSTGGAGRVVSTHRQGDITLELMESGVVRGTHAGHPGKSIVMQRDGSFQALDELGNVVGSGVVGQGGGKAASTQAWGSPGPAPANTDLSPIASGSTAMAPRSPSPWPAVSPFYTGGSGPGTLQPTPHNTSGRADNCGFTSLSYACSLQNPDAPPRTADDLYLQLLEKLGFTVDDNLSRMLVFPERSYEGLRPRPGYEPLFNDGGNRLSEYTVPSAARALEIPGTETNHALREWEIAFGPHRSIDDAVDARLLFLEERGASPDPVALREWIEARRAELPGTYIVGSRSSAHYMTITIEPDGTLTGFDPQNGAAYSSIEGVRHRMGHARFELTYKLTGPLPPTGKAQ